ncbi:MAG: hypothetical protein ACOC5M_01750 [Chloroflexota bacterium]
MKKTLIVLGLTAGLLVAVAGTAWNFAENAASGESYDNLNEAGAVFAPAFGEARDAEFDANVSKERAEKIAIGRFMRGFDLPTDRGIQEIIEARAVKAIFSGSSTGSSQDWDVHDRQAWVVVLHDIPRAIPCPGGCTEGTPRPRYTVAVDAGTGDVVGLDLSGAGPISSSYNGVDLKVDDPGEAEIPTPVPTASQ